jgi:hypothetical protein
MCGHGRVFTICLSENPERVVVSVQVVPTTSTLSFLESADSYSAIIRNYYVHKKNTKIENWPTRQRPGVVTNGGIPILFSVNAALRRPWGPPRRRRHQPPPPLSHRHRCCCCCNPHPPRLHAHALAPPSSRPPAPSPRRFLHRLRRSVPPPHPTRHGLRCRNASGR